ncbi:ATP-binding protein [Streptomyces sp. NPDC101160]|uniref:ATP-binding protein n=1 Tax=Streptomyces sp. NPDC101160 TaxID=3366118 RepID=UPI00382AE583
MGRRRELDLLLAAVKHPPAVVLVEGEAGIGKSRLIHEAAAVLSGQGRLVLAGSCHPLREPFPYGPVVDALRKAGPWLPAVDRIPPTAGALAPLLPDLADRLPAPPPPPEDPPARRYQVVQAVHSFLTVIGPAVLVMEDMHWADEATRDLLLLLARDLPKHLGLVLTYRSEDLPPATAVLGAAYRRPPGTSGTTIRLGPLTRGDIDELAVAALGAYAPPDLGGTLYARSEGLPLVAEEDLLTLSESGRHLDHRDIAAELRRADVPRGLSEAVTERLDVLTSAGAAIVDAAAVLAVPADETLLANVAGLDQDQSADGLTEAITASVLSETETGTYVFRHVLAQQVVYARIPGPRRARLHRRAVEVLAARNPAPLVQIAHHTLAVGDREGWLRRAEEAADHAFTVGDTGTAASLLHQILEQPGLPEESRSRAALALARTAYLGVDYETNAALLRRILADPRLAEATRGEIRLGLGLLMLSQAGDAAGFDELERAIGELSSHPERAARAMIGLAIREQGDGAKRAPEWMDRAERTIRDSPDEVIRAAVRATRLSLMSRQGDPAVWDLLDALPRDSDDLEILRHTVRALHNVGESAIDLGHDARAAALLTENRELSRRVGNSAIECYSRIDLLRLDAYAGRWNDLEERFADLAAEYPEIVPPSAERALCLARIAHARGQTSRALDLANAAAEHGRKHFEVNVALRAAAAQASALLAQGDAEAARAVSEPALDLLRDAEAWARPNSLIALALVAYLACGDREAAERLTDEFEAHLPGCDSPSAESELHYARGLLLEETDPARAAEHFDRSLRLVRAMGRPYETAWATVAYARAVARTDPEAAAGPLREAHDVFLRLGATSAAASCEQAMRELGLDQPAARPHRGYGNELSPREHQVAELLARGATNHDIAQTLFLSPRTVEKHVASVLKKLGTSRKDIGTAFKPGGQAR